LRIARAAPRLAVALNKHRRWKSPMQLLADSWGRVEGPDEVDIMGHK